jgi:hypothetical protein
MTVEERVSKLEEQMLVHAELVDRFERRVDAYVEKTDRRLASHESQMESHAHEMAEYRATAVRVLELLEKFVSGQSGGNGRS